MSYNTISNVCWALQIGLLVLLLWRVWHLRIQAHLPVFTVWLLWALLSNVPAFLFVDEASRNSALYVQYFTWSTVITYMIQLAVCWEVYAVVKTPHSALPWAAMTIALGLLSLDQLFNFRISIYWLSHIVPLHLQVYFVFAILFKVMRLPGRSLSRNLSGLIWYLTISNGIQYFAYSAPAFGILPYEVIRWFLQPSFLIATFVLVKYMRKLDLPIRSTVMEVYT